jgi:tRNA threonylcarbamoyladenosine biosynthesis protein TsaB
MIILTIRTDKPEAEVGLYDGTKQLAYTRWSARRELGATIHTKLAELLDGQQQHLHAVQAIVCFQGPGSFTGLRIGLTVGNALAYTLHIPIVARQEPQWLERGIADVLAGKNERIVLPEYGSPVHTTTQKH